MLPSLLSPHQMPEIAGLNTPAGFYVVVHEPAPLGGMPYPKPGTPWEAIFSLGFHHIVRLEMGGPPYDPAPLNLLQSTALEDLVNAHPPRDPQLEESLILEAVSSILLRLEAGEGVIVHCAGGTGRTGTVIGCCLVRLGHPAPQAIAYLDQLNKFRGEKGWPESDWQSGLVSRIAAGRVR